MEFYKNKLRTHSPDTLSTYDLQDRKQCVPIQNKSARDRTSRRKPNNPAQWAESDPDLAIGISVCSHIITRADGYKFTSNTMAIHHRDIIKVMPIAPAEPPAQHPISPTQRTQISTLFHKRLNSILNGTPWRIREDVSRQVMTERHISSNRASDYEHSYVSCRVYFKWMGSGGRAGRTVLERISLSQCSRLSQPQWNL